MLKEAIELLGTHGYIDGNSLPDSAPSNTYQFRSSSPSIIVPAPGMKMFISNILKGEGYTVKAMGNMLKISK